MLLTGRRMTARRRARLRPGQRGRAAGRARRGGRALGRRRSSPARRSRCRRSSRWCARRRLMSPREAQALRLPALVAALQSTDQDEGVQAFSREARAAVAGPLMTYVITIDLHRCEGRHLPEGLPGGVHLRGRPHDVHPARRMHQLRHLRLGLPGAGDLRGCRRAGRVEAGFIADQRASSSRRASPAGAPWRRHVDYVSELDMPLVKGFHATKS